MGEKKLYSLFLVESKTKSFFRLCYLRSRYFSNNKSGSRDGAVARARTSHHCGLVAVSRKPRKLFGPVKPLQNLEPCEYRAVLFTYSKDEGRFPS